MTARVAPARAPACSNGADALKKYEGDKEIIEAAMEAGDILQELQEAGVSGGMQCSWLVSCRLC